MVQPKKAIYDTDNPDRGLCSIDGCYNLQHNHGNRRWGKFCDTHHNEPIARAKRKRARDLHRGMLKTETAARNIEYRRNIDALRIFPRPCSVCGKSRQRTGFRTVLSTTCRSCKTEQAKNTYNKRLYGIDNNQYRAMLLSQNGVCAICGMPPKAGHRLVIDHCHSTSVVRGLLCGKCNIGLGHFGDDLDLLASATSYIINGKLKVVC